MRKRKKMGDKKVKIPIDRSTIRRNPNAGRTSILVPGRSCIVDGKETKQIQRVHTIYPEGAYLFEYAHTKVQCCHCEAVFDYYLLESDCSIDIDGETYSDTICPKCHGWDCCEMEFEEFDEKTMVPEEQKESERPTRSSGGNGETLEYFNDCGCKGLREIIKMLQKKLKKERGMK
jgi:hypothetical protein